VWEIIVKKLLHSVWIIGLVFYIKSLVSDCGARTTLPEVTMVRKKAGSKRVSLKDKYKIERKVREHHAKQRRATRRAGGSGKKMKKDPGIPNLWPWKEDMLQVRETKRRRD
jgi:hypothetical protein